jgi:mRNA interferase MazF
VKRGDIVIAASNGNFGKPRPYVVMQSDLFNPSHASVTMAPMSTHLLNAPLYRITVDPSETNGLTAICQIMVDKITTIPAEKAGKIIGRLEDDLLGRLNRAVTLWLGIG